MWACVVDEAVEVVLAWCGWGTVVKLSIARVVVG